MRAHLRVARATERLEEIVAMYRDGLGLELLGSFRDHGGFDGAMLGARGAEYHLEFTQQRGQPTKPPPDPDDLLVFYLPDAADCEAAARRMIAAGFAPVASHNPYWDRRGRTFEDLEGYRVVLQNTPWPPG